MTIQDIINWFNANPNVILSYFSVILILSLLGLLLIKPKHFKPPINYLYTILIYAVTIPGLLACILVLYGLFINKTNLLKVSVLAYFLPIIASIINIIIIKKTVPLVYIPGFNRLSGMILLIIITFIITYILQRMFFGVIFIGSFSSLIGLFLVLLIIINYAWKKIIK